MTIWAEAFLIYLFMLGEIAQSKTKQISADIHRKSSFHAELALLKWEYELKRSSFFVCKEKGFKEKLSKLATAFIDIELSTNNSI